MSKSKKGKFVLGAIVGAGLGLLFAPKKGEELRKDMKEAFDKVLAEVKNLDKDEVKTEIETRVNEIKKELEELTGEKVLEELKKGSKQLKSKTTQLVNYAAKKGTPVLQELTLEVKEKTANALKDLAGKLEK